MQLTLAPFYTYRCHYPQRSAHIAAACARFGINCHLEYYDHEVLERIVSPTRLGVGFKITSGPVLDKPGDLAGLLTSLEENDVLFIDEITPSGPVVEEYLYSAMEDYRIDIMIDKGPGARTVQLTLAPFTLIGATTRSGLLTSPLRARFGINCHLGTTTTRCSSVSCRQRAWCRIQDNFGPGARQTGRSCRPAYLA